MPESGCELHAQGPSRRVVILKAVAVMAVALLLLGLRGLLTVFSGLLMAGLALLYVIIDYQYWIHRGVRKIELDAEHLTLWSGRGPAMQQVSRERISAIGVYRKISLVRVVFFLGGGPLKVIPGFTYFTGPRIIITNEYFDTRDFEKFLVELRELGYPLQASS